MSELGESPALLSGPSPKALDGPGASWGGREVLPFRMRGFSRRMPERPIRISPDGVVVIRATGDKPQSRKPASLSCGRSGPWWDGNCSEHRRGSNAMLSSSECGGLDAKCEQDSLGLRGAPIRGQERRMLSRRAKDGGSKGRAK